MIDRLSVLTLRLQHAHNSLGDAAAVAEIRRKRVFMADCYDWLLGLAADGRLRLPPSLRVPKTYQASRLTDENG